MVMTTAIRAGTVAGMMMAAMAPVATIAADMAPVKPLKAPPAVAVSADDRASFEMEGIWDRTRFAPRRTFGAVRPFNAQNDGFDPSHALMDWDSKGNRYGTEGTFRTRPFFHTGDIPTRLFVSGIWLSDRAKASGSDPLNAAGDSAFLAIPLIGSFGTAGAIGNNFYTAFPRSASWQFDSRGDTFGGAIGLQWDLRRGPLRVDTSAGFRLEKLDRKEDIAIGATGFQVNLGNPASLNYASRVGLDATFTAATFATRWAYAVSPYLDLIGRGTFDVGRVTASLDGNDSFTLTALGLGTISGSTSASVSRNAMWLRAGMATGFAWHPRPDISLTLLGTASWQSNVPYAVYATLGETPSGMFRASTLSVGFADQTSYGVRGGVTVAFGP
jgi:hypothetical protein